jgi:hypothetical protein
LCLGIIAIIDYRQFYDIFVRQGIGDLSVGSIFWATRGT